MLAQQNRPQSDGRLPGHSPPDEEPTLAADLPALRQLALMDAATLAALRRQRPAILPATGLGAFLRQGLSQIENRTSQGVFGTVMAAPAALLTAYQKLLELIGVTADDAFPAGPWQFYTEFGLREDAARHANETTGFHEATQRTPGAGEVDQAAAWVFQAITTLFEYDALLENEWEERILLHLFDEAIADSVAEKMARLRFPLSQRLSPAELAALKEEVRRAEPERVEIEAARLKRGLGLDRLDADWVSRRPYSRDRSVAGETYPQYRRRMFLNYLTEVADRLPTYLGAYVWERYYDRLAVDLPAFQQQMSILYALKPGRYKDDKEPIPLWQAKIAFVCGGRYYLLNAAHHDEHGRVLAFEPGNPKDPGEPLLLSAGGPGQVIDQHGRQIEVDRRGNVHITEDGGRVRLKILRPTPAQHVRACVAAILREARVLAPAAGDVDLLLAQAPRAAQNRLRRLLPAETQHALRRLRLAPITINWDERPRRRSLGDIRRTRRGIGDHALTILRTESSFVFDQSHIFFDAIWGMALSQIMTDGAVEAFDLISQLPRPPYPPPLSPLHLSSSDPFRRQAAQIAPPGEVIAETGTAELPAINRWRRVLAGANVEITVNDVLTFYRSLHDKVYTPGLDLQLRLARFRQTANPAIADQIEAMWARRRRSSPSLLLPMDASFVDPRLRLFPATFRNFFPDFMALHQRTGQALEALTFHPSPAARHTFLILRSQLVSHLLVLVEHFRLLKRVTRQGESMSTAAIRYLAHLPPSMQGTLDWIPQHIDVLNEVVKGEEVFSNVGRVAPNSSLTRFISAKDDGDSKQMVWGIMTDSAGRLKISLRDFRPHVAQLTALGHRDLARLVAADYLEAYARGLNAFVEDSIRILTANLA